jgi:hypothetical protein
MMLTGEHILALLLEPSAATYGEVLRCVVEHEDFNYDSSELRTLQQQVVAGDLTGVQDRLRESRRGRPDPRLLRARSHLLRPASAVDGALSHR